MAGEGYEACWDTTNNGTCDTGWQANGAATTKPLYGLPVGTYYWQVKTVGGGLQADEGTWWSFTVTVPYVAPDHWKAEYFGNVTLSGPPVATVDEGTGFVDHSWGTGGPAGLSDFFSTRFTRTVTLAAGRYRFTQTTDDGSRLWVDDQLQIDAWGVDGLTTHTVDLDLAAGDHTLRFQSVEYTGGATAQLTWTPVLDVPAGVWTAEYFANMALSGPPASTVEEVSAFIDHNWGDGGPEALPVDGFSARFTRTLAFPAGTYRFTVVTDDGSRVWIDDQLVIDAWWDQAPSTYTADVALAAGDHTVRYECYENGGGAVAQLSWAFAPEPEPTPPEAAAGGTLGTAAPENPVGPAGRAAGLLLGVIALFGLAVRAVRRWRLAAQPHAGLRRSADGGQAASRVHSPLSATALWLTAMLLVPAGALAQIPTQVVEYYHTDVLGSVRAVTKQVNGEWQVVARHDFMPFGEEVAAPIPPQDKRLFTGKERDSETGQDYFEARYLRATAGRFTTVDPKLNVKETLVDPQRWNRYAYALDNPLRYVDTNGKWPTSIHNRILDAAFPGLSDAQRQLLKDASSNTDFNNRVNGRDPQAPENSFLHAMRGPEQTVEDARALMGGFIADNEKAAAAAQSAHAAKGGQGLANDALTPLGNALHPVMDSSSPGHAGFQQWTGSGLFGQKLLAHGAKELTINTQQLNAAMAACRAEYLKLFGAEALRLATTTRAPQ